MQAFEGKIAQVAVKYGLSSLPSLGDPNFISTVVFDQTKVGGIPKAKLSYLFPNADAAQIVIRLRPNLSDDERNRAINLIGDVVNDTTPRKECAPKGGKPEPCFKLTGGGSYVVSGAPVVVKGLADVLRSALLVLFAAAVLLMALTLLLVFRSRFRLLPLAIALGAAGITFGLLGLVDGKLTMASIAVLPVLIGLAVDYAIQLQARFDEEVAAGSAGPEAARAAAARAAPVVGIACLATAAGFAVLQLSPTPMVRSFGLLLVAGIAIAFALAMTAGFAALALRPRARIGSADKAGTAMGATRGRIARRTSTLGREALAVSIASPGRVIFVAVALAVCGWAAGTQTKTVSDIRDLVPSQLPEVRDLNKLEAATGVSGELDVTVRAPDLTDPRLVTWMSRFKQRVLEENGFGGHDPKCSEAQICPGPALTDFLTDPEAGVTRQRVQDLISALPAYDLKGVISTDPKTGAPGHTANIAFGIRTQSLADQQALIDRVRSAIDEGGPGGPPPGVTVNLAGLPVIAAQSATDISHSRYWLTLAGLLAVAIVLLAVYRSVLRALVPLAPIVLATGWSALVLAAMEIPINPMSAALGALVIAISTEFSVILAARYHEERGGGRSVGEALRRAYERTGAAVLASGVTAIVGFAALAIGPAVAGLLGFGDLDIRMLRDFGVVTVVDLGVALLGVMLVLPATLVWAERSTRRT
jgi:hydrophobe/amphiphile efflux-3 (HAE3) family protein